MPGEKDESLQTAFLLYILAEGRDIVDGKRIGVLMECSGAERRQNDNLLIPYAHKGKSSDNSLDRSLDRALMCSGGVSESSRICLQSLKSRLCGGNRWLPSDQREEGKCRFLYNIFIHLLTRTLGHVLYLQTNNAL